MSQLSTVHAPFDLNHLRHFTDGDDEQERLFYAIFMKQADEIIGTIEQSLDQNDNDLWTRSVHKLKGSAANLGARRLAELCNQGEKTTLKDLEDSQELALKIKNEVITIKAFMEERMN